jgi:hypothetical protein
MFTWISFAYFGGKRKEEGLTQRHRGRRDDEEGKISTQSSQGCGEEGLWP